MTYNEQTRILKADEGKWIMNRYTYAIEARLAPGDSVDNWREVDHSPEPIEPPVDEYEFSEPEE